MKQTRVGLGLGFTAYALWGAFPFYFTLIAAVSPFEAVVWRVTSTFAFCVILVSISKTWLQVRGILASPRLLGWFALSSVLLYINWQIFVAGVMFGHIIQTSLGYFINPLVTILIGVFIRKEKLTRMQWLAAMIAAVGIIAVAVGYGRFPWISIGLALSFGFYGAVHKHVGADIQGLTGLTVETFVAIPIALVQGIVIFQLVGFTAHTFGTGILVLVMLSGLITAIPLILFGEAARRLPLSYVGFLQFLTPILSFLYGYFIAGEEMSYTRWLGFVAVWIALTLLIFDMVRQIKQAPVGSKPSLNTEPIPLD